MQIGIPKEIKPQESRVALTPSAVGNLVDRGHDVRVQTTAGEGAGFSDEQYRQAGALVVEDAATVFAQSTLLVKVKEPQVQEIEQLRHDHLLFTYLHLAASKALTQGLMDRGVTALAYEGVEVDGQLPLLAPMSEIAGSMAAVEGAHFLQRHFGGQGSLIATTNVPEEHGVLVLGGGTAGINAARVALGMGAPVTVLEKNPQRIQAIKREWPVMTVLESSDAQLRRCLPHSAVVIGAVLLPNGRAPVLITREHLRLMQPGSVLVDIAIDQGGCAETSRATTHADPVFVEEGVVHYCVANMPGAYAATASRMLSAAILPYVCALAADPIDEILKQQVALKKAVNIYRGRLVQSAVAAAHNFECDLLVI